MDEVISYLKSNPQRAAFYAQSWEEVLVDYPQLISLQDQKSWDQFRREHPGLNLDPDLWIYGPASLEDEIQDLIEKIAETELTDDKQKRDEKGKQMSVNMHAIVGYVMIKNGDGEIKPLLNASVTVTDIKTKAKIQTLTTDSRGYFKTRFLLPYKKYLLVLRHKDLGTKERKRVVNMKAFQPPLRIVFSLSTETNKDEKNELNSVITESKDHTNSEISSSAIESAIPTNTAPPEEESIPFTERAGFTTEKSTTSQQVTSTPRRQVFSPRVPPSNLKSTPREVSSTPQRRELKNDISVPENEIIQSVDQEILRMTTLSEAVRGITDKNSPTWIKENAKISAHRWDIFIQTHPELAKQYTTYPPIAAALARQLQQKNIESSTSKPPYMPFNQEEWFKRISQETEQEGIEDEQVVNAALEEEEKDEYQQQEEQIKNQEVANNQSINRNTQQQTIRENPQRQRSPEGVRQRTPIRSVGNRIGTRIPGIGGRGGMRGITGKLGSTATKGIIQGVARAGVLLFNPGNPLFWIMLLILFIFLLFILFFGFEEPDTKNVSVSLSKSGPSEVSNTDQITYTLNVSLSGGSAQSILVSDPIAENAKFISANPPAKLLDVTGKETQNAEEVRKVEWTLGGVSGSQSGTLTTPSLSPPTDITVTQSSSSSGSGNGFSGSQTLTLTIEPTGDDTYVINEATAQAVGTSTGIGGTSGDLPPVGDNLPPNTDDCAGTYNLSSNNADQRNYGDPGCTLANSPRVPYSFQGKSWSNVPQALIDLLNQLDPNNTGYWIGIISCEAPGFDPNNVTFFVGETPTPDSGGAWGLFQMGRSTAGPYKLGDGLNGPYDRGDVNWQNQVSNAINYNKKLGGSWRYWACASMVWGLW